jgi:hypothetical protein
MDSTTIFPHFLKFSISSFCSALIILLALWMAPALWAQIDAPSMRPFSRLGVDVNVGTLGVGVEVATPLATRFNLRGSGNFFHYTTNINRGGLVYVTALDMRSAQASLDWFPWRNAFHLSPGVMFYNGIQMTANVQAPPNTSFTINGATFYSDPSDPLTGYGKVTFPTVGPQLTIGLGNMIPRSNHKHFSFPVEAGVVYFGPGNILLNFSGSECLAPGGAFCQKASSSPNFQADVAAAKSQIRTYVNYFGLYPILRMGLSYKF